MSAAACRASGPSRFRWLPCGGGIQGWGPRAQPCAAAVPSGASRVTRQRVRGCSGGGLQQAAGVAGVGQSPAAGLAGRGRPAVGGAGRDGEVDQRGERRRRPGRDAGHRRGGCRLSRVPRRSCCHSVMSGQPSQLRVIIAVAGVSAVVAACAVVVARACIPAGHVVRLGRVAGRLLARCRAAGAVLAGWPGGPGSGEAGARVPALGQVVEGQHPQLLQAAGQPAAVQRHRERVDVRLGRQHILGRQFPAGQERVTGVFPARRHPLPVGAGLVLAALERLGVEFHRHRGGLAGQLVIPQPRRQAGQQLIGTGGVGVGQVLGGFPDEPGPVAVDEPGAQRRPGAGQPGWQVEGHVHHVLGGAGGGDQFHAELGVGELPVPAAARHLRAPSRRPAGLRGGG